MLGLPGKPACLAALWYACWRGLSAKSVYKACNARLQGLYIMLVLSAKPECEDYLQGLHSKTALLVLFAKVV